MERRTNARREKRRDAAEQLCKAFRTLITTPAWQQSQAQWDVMYDWLTVWMDNNGKARYDKPDEPPYSRREAARRRQ